MDQKQNSATRSDRANRPVQDTLFAIDPEGSFVVPRDFLDTPIHPLASRITDIDSLTPEQQVHLRGTLRLLGRMSRLTGLMNGADNPHVRGRLELQMEVDKVVGKSQDAFRALSRQAQEEFSKASGKYVLLAAGVDPAEVDRMMAERYEPFMREYADPPNQKKRASLIGKLDRRLKKQRDEDPNNPVVSLKPRGRGRAERPDTPERIIINTEKVEEITNWLDGVRLPVVDELTMGYRIKPIDWSVRSYTGARKIGKKRVAEGPNSLDPEVRQVWHVAGSAEHYLGFNYALAYLREKAIAETVEATKEQRIIPITAGRYAAGAIEEFGYCMRFSANIPQTKFGNQAEHIERFGRRAFDFPDMLIMSEGKALLKAANAEQRRRLNYMGPRYQAVIGEFGTQIPVEMLDIENIEQLTIAQLLVNRARTSENAVA